MSRSLFNLGRALVVLVAFFLGQAGAFAAKPSAPAPAPSGPKYFYNIDLDPRYQIIGIGPLNADAAPTADCYCFTYGADGKLQRIEYTRAGVAMTDPFFNAARIDFEYAPGKERRWYRDANGQPVTNLNGVEGEELTLNAAGFPTAVTNLNHAGGRMRDTAGVIRYSRTLDSQNRLVRGLRSGLLGTNIKDNSGYYETRTSYDAKDKPVEYGNYDAAGRPLDNNDGVALIRTTYTYFPDQVQAIESYFDATGQPASEKSTGVHQRQSVYDLRGFLLSEAYFDASGAPDIDDTTGIHESRYTYDDRGNQLSEEYYGIDGQPKNRKPGGYAREDYRYDAKNRVSEKSFTGDDGSPQVLPDVGAAVIRQEYDDAGNITRRQFFDGQGNPSPHVQYGVPAIRIKVDGDTTIVTLRDEHDEITRNPISGYASFSYKTARDHPLTRHNLYYDLRGRPMSTFRVFVINPHLHVLKQARGMRHSAHFGALAAGLGALLAMALALRKASFTKRRKVYVPSPFERFLGWLAVFAIVEGSIRFFITIWWAYVGYQNGRMGSGVYIMEAIVIIFFVYRIPRMWVTMRVLNIGRDDIHRIVADYFTRANLHPDRKTPSVYRTYPFLVRITYFQNKAHAYLVMRYRHRDGRELMRGFAQYVREQVAPIEAPMRSRALALYYPCVACAYFMLASLAFYTLWQMIKH
jgi:hypothetical protein